MYLVIKLRYIKDCNRSKEKYSIESRILNAHRITVEIYIGTAISECIFQFLFLDVRVILRISTVYFKMYFAILIGAL